MSIVTGIDLVRGVARLSVDGRFFCAVDEKTFALFPLGQGDALDPDEYMGRVAASQAARAYEAALSMLDRSAKTSAQVNEGLLRKGFVPMAAEAAVMRLTENRLLDDSQFARRMVELSEGRPVGRYALKRKLRGKGVSEEDADEALSAISDAAQLEGAREAAGKLLRRYQDETPFVAKRKLSQALGRRGFGWDTIAQVVDALFTQDEW